MKILLSGPGTGKTSKIQEMIHQEYDDAENILVLSFTNATVNDLTESFKDWPNVSCYTLHSYALKINHLIDFHILDNEAELPIIKKIVDKIDIEYSELSRMLKFITFDDMIKKCVSFLNVNPAYGKENIGNLDLLIVDEFQDFNEDERALVYQIVNHSEESFILGDDDQSIYGFKDADPQGIIDLYNNESVEKISNENKCYRCPDKIVRYSSKLIQKNRTRIKKKWECSGKAGNIHFIQKISQEESAAYICDEIEKIISKDPTDSILILSPVGFYSELVTNELDEREIIYVDFWKKRIEIEQWMTIWWLHAIYSDNRFLNILFLSKFLSTYRKRKFLEIIKNSFNNNFDDTKIINDLFPIFTDSNIKFVKDIPLIDEFFDQPQNCEEIREMIDSNDISKSISNLSQTIRQNTEYENNGINIMSIHKSKGLQAKHVFIFGLVDGVLPNKTRGLETIEAQRRLLFVGMTRALENLYLVSTIQWEGKIVHKLDKSQFKYIYQKKIYYGRTSSFIEEMKDS